MVCNGDICFTEDRAWAQKERDQFPVLLQWYGWIRERARWSGSCVLTGLIDRTRWLFIAGSGLPALILPKKILFGSSIDQAYSVKMAGYWRGFFCQEKRLGHYPTIFTQQERLITHISWIKALVCEGSIIKDLLYSKNNFLSLLQHSAKSRASKMGPCCPLG